MPVPRCLEATEEGREPGELRRLVDRKAGEHGERAKKNDESVGEFLQWVVLALRGMFLPQPQIVLLHFDCAANVARTEQQGSPLAADGEIREIEQTCRDERPHQREVPIQAAGTPATETAPVREFPILKRIDVVRTATLTESRVGRVNLQPARDHSHDQHERRPMREADDPVMTLHLNGNRRSRCGRWGGGSRHATSILSAMRLATLCIIGILSSCRPAPRDAYVP